MRDAGGSRVEVEEPAGSWAIDAATEKACHDLAKLVGRNLNVSIVLVSLVDATQQQTLTYYANEPYDPPLETSFCDYVVAQGRPVVVDSALAARSEGKRGASYDPRFRFYVGVPLVTQAGGVIGSLCALGSHPRQVTDVELDNLIIIARQLADRLELRRELTLARCSSKQDEIDRPKLDFVSTVSHELRTPLTSIRGALGLLAAGRVDRASEEAGEMIDIALQNSERVVRLINEMLDIERLEAGDLQLHLEPMELSEALREAVVSNGGFALAHGTKIAVVGELPPAQVYGDPDRVAQVFANLLSNAVKFTPLGEVVTVGVEVFEDRARVTVEDRGPGVPPDFESHLFTRFAQADNTDSRRSSGTGLGLSISKSLVERMGGVIGYEPREQVGSRFYFDLPLALGEGSGIYKRHGRVVLPIYGGALCVNASSYLR